MLDISGSWEVAHGCLSLLTFPLLLIQSGELKNYSKESDLPTWQDLLENKTTT